LNSGSFRLNSRLILGYGGPWGQKTGSKVPDFGPFELKTGIQRVRTCPKPSVKASRKDFFDFRKKSFALESFYGIIIMIVRAGRQSFPRNGSIIFPFSCNFSDSPGVFTNEMRNKGQTSFFPLLFAGSFSIHSAFQLIHSLA
jgi:hypothetical protein